MKTRISKSIYALAVIAGAITLAGGAQAALRYQEKQKLESAVNDKYYGDSLAEQLDAIYSITFSHRGLVSSNDVISLQAKDATVIHANWSDTSSATSRGSFDCYWSSDSKGYTPVAMTTLTLGTNGNIIEDVSNEHFTAITNSAGKVALTVTGTHSSTFYLNCRLPNAKTTRASFTF